PGSRATSSRDSLAARAAASLESLSLEPLPPEIPTTLGKRIPLGLPLAAPPPTNPGAQRAAAADLPLALPPPPLPPRPLPARSQAAVLPDRADDLPGPAPIAKHTPPVLPSLQLPTAGTKPVPEALDAFPAGPEPPELEPAAPDASSGHLTTMTSAAVAVAAADSHGSMRRSAPYPAPVERHGWP